VRALLRKRAVREEFYLWGDTFLGMWALLREHYEVSEFREEHFYMLCTLFKRCMFFWFLEITCFSIHPFQRSILRAHKIWSPALCRNEQKIMYQFWSVSHYWGKKVTFSGKIRVKLNTVFIAPIEFRGGKNRIILSFIPIF
jgi:hypothetical protein